MNKILLILTMIFMITACSPQQIKVPIVSNEYTDRVIPKVDRPDGLSLTPPKVIVLGVSSEGQIENLDAFQEFMKGELTFTIVAMSVPSYESLALSFNDIKRYITDSGFVFEYYESYTGSADSINNDIGE